MGVQTSGDWKGVARNLRGNVDWCIAEHEMDGAYCHRETIMIIELYIFLGSNEYINSYLRIEGKCILELNQGNIPTTIWIQVLHDHL